MSSETFAAVGTEFESESNGTRVKDAMSKVKCHLQMIFQAAIIFHQYPQLAILGRSTNCGRSGEHSDWF